jgi:hypothetical protein
VAAIAHRLTDLILPEGAAGTRQPLRFLFRRPTLLPTIAAMPAATASARTEIHAPIELVWQIMTDVAAYPQWNPFIVRIDAPKGPLAVGQALRLHVRWEDGGDVVSPEVITRSEAPSQDGAGGKTATLAYRYVGLPHRLHLVRGTRLQTLEQLPGQPTVYSTHEEFTGFLVALMPLRKVRAGFVRHAAALRARAEQLAAQKG